MTRRPSSYPMRRRIDAEEEEEEEEEEEVVGGGSEELEEPVGILLAQPFDAF